MTNAQADEVPFLAGMERDSSLCHTTLEISKKLFTLDGMVERVLEKGREAMEARTDRGPDPDADINSTDRVLLELLRELRNIRPPSYSNGDSSDELKKWIAGVGAALSISFIIGGWVISTQVAALTVKVDALMEHQRTTDERLSRLEQNERRGP